MCARVIAMRISDTSNLNLQHMRRQDIIKVTSTSGSMRNELVVMNFESSCYL